MRLLSAGCALLLVVALPAASRAQGTAVSNQGTADAPVVAEGFFASPPTFARVVDKVGRRIADPSASGDGFYFESGNMITGAGWITVGSGYRHRFWGNRAVADASAGVSWRLYKMARASVELPELRNGTLLAGSEVRWQDNAQVTYFGAGDSTEEFHRTQYRLRSTSVTGYVTARPASRITVDARLGRIFSPALGPPNGAFIRDVPFTRELFPADPVFARARQPDYLFGEVAVTGDTRDRPGRPTRGGLYRAGWSAYSGRGDGSFGLRQFQSEAVHFVPLSRERLVFAMRGWLVASDTSAGQTIPFYLLPSLGGNNTLRGYTDYRFHDRHMMVVTGEARVAVLSHLDVAAFVDAGNVAARFRDLDLGKRTYGAGVRLHTRGTTFARLEAATGDEGWHVVFRLNDPLNLKRLLKRSAPLPIVP